MARRLGIAAKLDATEGDDSCAQATRQPSRLPGGAKRQRGWLLCRRAVGASQKGEDPRQSIVAASELGSVPCALLLSSSGRHAAVPSLNARSQRNPHRFHTRASISGSLPRNPRPTQNITPPSLAYPASDPLISRQFSSPTLLAQALQYPPVHWHALRRDLARQLPNRILTSCPAAPNTFTSVSAPAASASDSSCPP
jgi:hypothetical protein